jgi:hypothetical protein
VDHPPKQPRRPPTSPPRGSGCPPVRGVVSVAELATCCRCGKERPLEEFARDASKASGRKGRCKSCDNARCRDYYARNRDKVIARVIARRGPPQLATCPTCGEKFAKTNGRQRYCKPEHRPTTGDRGAKVTVTCACAGANSRPVPATVPVVAAGFAASRMRSRRATLRRRRRDPAVADPDTGVRTCTADGDLRVVRQGVPDDLGALLLQGLLAGPRRVYGRWWPHAGDRRRPDC